MIYNELILNLEAKAKDGIATDAGTDWISSINEIGHSYDFFLLIPPAHTDANPRDRRWRSYSITCYLFRKNGGESGTRYTKAQRNMAWSELQQAMDQFITKINNSTSGSTGLIDMRILGEIRSEPDEGKIGVDDLVWVKATFTLSVENC